MSREKVRKAGLKRKERSNIKAEKTLTKIQESKELKRSRQR